MQVIPYHMMWLWCCAVQGIFFEPWMHVLKLFAILLYSSHIQSEFHNTALLKQISLCLKSGTSERWRCGKEF